MAPRQPYDWRKRWDLVSLRNVKSEEQARVSRGRLFHARAAATGKVRPPRVARRVDGTYLLTYSICTSHSSAPDAAERCCPPGCWCEQTWPYFTIPAWCSPLAAGDQKWFSSRLRLPHLIASVASVQPTSKTSAPQWSTPPVKQTSVRPIAVTCLPRQPAGYNSADEASVLLLQLSGTVFLFICAHHLSIEDNSELGWKPISSIKPIPASENDLF